MQIGKPSRSARQKQLREFDERLLRWQHEHPVQAWTVAFVIAGLLAGLVWLFGYFIQKGTQ
jgi:hypothetical protein